MGADNLEKNEGLMVKNFMKKQLKHENELEDQIAQLKIQLRNINLNNSNRLADIFRSAISEGNVSVKIDQDKLMYSFNIDNSIISLEDAEFLEREILRIDMVKYKKSNSDELGLIKDSKLDIKQYWVI